MAERLNGYLGDDWPAPPWDGDQVATLALCLEMAGEQAIKLWSQKRQQG